MHIGKRVREEERNTYRQESERRREKCIQTSEGERTAFLSPSLSLSLLPKRGKEGERKAHRQESERVRERKREKFQFIFTDEETQWPRGYVFTLTFIGQFPGFDPSSLLCTSSSNPVGKLDRASSQSVEEKNMSGPFASVTTRKDSKAVINRRITARVKYLYIKHNFAHIPESWCLQYWPCVQQRIKPSDAGIVDGSV